MKKNYVAPKLTSFGNVTEMTQSRGTENRQDFIFTVSGVEIGGGNDLGSADVFNVPDL